MIAMLNGFLASPAYSSDKGYMKIKVSRSIGVVLLGRET
jgi:hypothetical protein